MVIYLFDPDTKQYIGEQTVVSEIPQNSTYIPPDTFGKNNQFWVNGQWTFDNPNTPGIELPVFSITEIQIDAPIDNGIWDLDAKKVYQLSAKTTAPKGNFRAIIEKVVNKQVKSDLRFRATIQETENGNVVSLPLYFEETGNYQITAERLNQGLLEINAGFQLTFNSVDIDVLVAIPT